MNVIIQDRKFSLTKEQLKHFGYLSILNTHIENDTIKVDKEDDMAVVDNISPMLMLYLLDKNKFQDELKQFKKFIDYKTDEDLKQEKHMEDIEKLMKEYNKIYGNNTIAEIFNNINNYFRDYVLKIDNSKKSKNLIRGDDWSFEFNEELLKCHTYNKNLSFISCVNSYSPLKFTNESKLKIPKKILLEMDIIGLKIYDYYKFNVINHIEIVKLLLKDRRIEPDEGDI